MLAAATSTLSVREVLSKVCQATLAFSAGDAVSIFLIDEKTGGSVPMMAAGRKPNISLSTFLNAPPEATTDEKSLRLFRAMARRKKPLFIKDAGTSDLVGDWWVKEFGIGSLVAYPLRAKGRLIGMMTIDTEERNARVLLREMDTLAAVAGQAAVIIENARLYECEQHQRERSERMASVMAAASSTLSLRQVCVKVCEAALDLTIGDNVAIFVLDDEDRWFVPMASIGGETKLTGKFLHPPAEVMTGQQMLQISRMIGRRRTPLVVEDATDSPYTDPWWVENFDLKSLVFYPLVTKDKTIGFINVSTMGERRKFPREEVQTLDAIAKQAAVIIENVRLYEREQRQRQRSEKLAGVFTAASETMSLRQVCVKICEAALDLTVGDNTAIFLMNEETRRFYPVSSVGTGGADDTRAFLSPPSEITSSAIYRQRDRMQTRLRKPYAADDASTSPYTHPWWIDVFGLKSIAYYPLLTKGGSIGMMVVTSRGTAQTFTNTEIDTLDALAKQAAVIIENARLYEREQRQRQRSEQLMKVLAAASETLSLRQVCARLCEATLELTAGQYVSVFLRAEDSDWFFPISAAGGGDADELKEFLHPPPGIGSDPRIIRFSRKIAARRKPLIVEDATVPPYADSWFVKNFNLTSLAYYPLRVKNKAIGFISIAARGEKQAFTREEIDTLSSLAAQAAVIIENARLYEQQQSLRQRAEGLVNVLTAAASTLSLKKVLSVLCQSVVDISVGDRASIFLMAEDGSHLEPVMAMGADDPALWEKFRNPRPGFESAPESLNLFQAMTTMEEPVVWEDAPSSPMLDKWWVETFQIKSLVQYPLRVKDRTIGMMTVDAFRRAVRFPKEEIDALAAIAKQAAVIIENARVYEQEQRQRQRAEALVDVLTTAASALGLNKVLVKICQTAADISVADRVSVFLMEESGRLKPMMSLGVEDAELWERFRNSSQIARPDAGSSDLRQFYGALTKLDRPVVIEDAPSSPLVPRWWCEAFEVKSLVHYPLRIKDKTIGLMTVDAFRQQVAFPKEELDTLAAIAKQAAVVIENARLHEQLQEQAITDHITGLFNHRHIFERLDEEFARASRTDTPFAVMMMDVDKFKDFNDTYGHPQGDEALRFIGRKLKETLRATDIVGRYGGDEFMAILPDTTRDQAKEAGQRITAMLADSPFAGDNPGQSVPLAMSIGIASYPNDSAAKDELLMLADGALYEAKRLGGSRALPVSAADVESVSAQSLGFGLLQGLLNAVAHKDPYTIRHCEDNVRYVDQIADRLNLTPEATESLRKAALLHDVGKIAIPDQTLLKPGPLDRSEWEVMQQHVRFGEMIVKGIAQISDAIEPVATHHERFDGQGYPRGLTGEEIPLLGRILAVVDAFSAMTLDRPYRKALPVEEAVEELRKGAGSQFDPDVVEAFLETLDVSRGPRRKVA